MFQEKIFWKNNTEKKKYFVKFNDLENCERVEYVGNVSDNVKPFVYDFALWTMQRFIVLSFWKNGRNLYDIFFNEKGLSYHRLEYK